MLTSATLGLRGRRAAAMRFRAVPFATLLASFAVSIAQAAPNGATSLASPPTASPPARQGARPGGPAGSPSSPPQRHAAPRRPIDYGRTGNLFAALCALVLTFLTCYPVLAFVRRGWGIKKADIFSSLTPDAKACYLKNFNYEGAENAETTFDKMYVNRYGLYRLFVPTLLLVLVTFPLLFLELCSGIAPLLPAGAALDDPDYPLLTLPPIAQAAAAGAFAWTVASLIDGAARYNLPPKAILGAAVRLAVAIPLGYAVKSIAAAEIAPFIAFAVGAFPLSEVQVLLKRLTTNKLGLDVVAERLEDRVTRLDGVDQQTADRLGDGDVFTISQMAYCDPVQLSMRTNLTFTSIIDAQSQALAWIYVGDSLPQLTKIGLRGAIEIANLMDVLDPEKDPSGHAHKLMAIASARTGVAPDGTARPAIDPDGLRHAFGEIAGDPYTTFLDTVWSSTGQTEGPDSDERPPPQPASAEGGGGSWRRREGRRT